MDEEEELIEYQITLTRVGTYTGTYFVDAPSEDAARNMALEHAKNGYPDADWEADYEYLDTEIELVAVEEC